MTNVCVLTNNTLAYCILAILTTIGWLMRVSEGFSPAHSEWAQLYGYLTGTEPFEGEYLCWKIW